MSTALQISQDTQNGTNGHRPAWPISQYYQDKSSKLVDCPKREQPNRLFKDQGTFLNEKSPF